MSTLKRRADNQGKTIPSIPSKFETVFNNEAEADGFGRRSYRFASEITDVPGPGAYDSKSRLASNGVGTSQSRRGFGVGFASQSDRFGSK
jgi:hypothetical protein